MTGVLPGHVSNSTKRTFEFSVTDSNATQIPETSSTFEVSTVKHPSPCCDRILITNSSILHTDFAVFERNGTMINGHTLYLGKHPKNVRPFAVWYDGDEQNPDWII